MAAGNSLLLLLAARAGAAATAVTAIGRGTVIPDGKMVSKSE